MRYPSRKAISSRARLAAQRCITNERYSVRDASLDALIEQYSTANNEGYRIDFEDQCYFRREYEAEAIRLGEPAVATPDAREGEGR